MRRRRKQAQERAKKQLEKLRPNMAEGMVDESVYDVSAHLHLDSGLSTSTGSTSRESRPRSR